jgi:hypothetical protein
VPSWVLFAGLMILLAALGYGVWVILNFDKERSTRTGAERQRAPLCSFRSLTLCRVPCAVRDVFREKGGRAKGCEGEAQRRKGQRRQSIRIGAFRLSGQTAIQTDSNELARRSADLLIC